MKPTLQQASGYTNKFSIPSSGEIDAMLGIPRKITRVTSKQPSIYQSISHDNKNNYKRTMIANRAAYLYSYQTKSTFPTLWKVIGDTFDPKRCLAYHQIYKCDICLKEFDNSMKLGGHKSRNHMKEMRLAKKIKLEKGKVKEDVVVKKEEGEEEFMFNLGGVELDEKDELSENGNEQSESEYQQENQDQDKSSLSKQDSIYVQSRQQTPFKEDKIKPTQQENKTTSKTPLRFSQRQLEIQRQKEEMQVSRTEMNKKVENMLLMAAQEISQTGEIMFRKVKKLLKAEFN